MKKIEVNFESIVTLLCSTLQKEIIKKPKFGLNLG